MDAMQHAEARKLPATAAVPVGAHLSVPIRLSDGGIYGTFCCFSRTADFALSARDVETMRCFADITAKFIEQAQEIDLQQSLELAVIAKALRNLGRLPEDAYVSINASPATVLSGALELRIMRRRSCGLMDQRQTEVDFVPRHEDAMVFVATDSVPLHQYGDVVVDILVIAVKLASELGDGQ